MFHGACDDTFVIIVLYTGGSSTYYSRAPPLTVPPLGPTHPTPRRAKAYCPKAFREWSSRWPRLAGELAAYGPDILALQVQQKDTLGRCHSPTQASTSLYL